MSTRERSRLVWAVATIVALIASFSCVYLLCRFAHAQPAPAILAAILTIGIARRRGHAHRGPLLLVPFAVAGTALAATGVGWLLLKIPLLGASVFIGGVCLSIWLRNFGDGARRAGALIALPFVTMLVAPARADAPGGLPVDIALVVAAAIVPMLFVAAVRAIVERASPAASVASPDRFPAPERAKRGGLSAPSRMTLQMAVALGGAFAAGFLAFPQHWGWVVLTAFIVCSGARGRGDAAHKGILRLTGAIAGTAGAAVLTHLWLPAGPAEAAVIFTVLFFGIWLREINYAYWACSMTLVLALLSRPDGPIDLALLGTRLAAIFAGAVCGVAAAWFVAPIRTEAVVRRRLADALAALDDAFAAEAISHHERSAKLALFEHRVHELISIATPVRWHRRVFVRGDPSLHPATWIDLTERLQEPARVLGSEARYDPGARGPLLRAIRTSRRAIAAHANPEAMPGVPPLGVALRALHETACAAVAGREATGTVRQQS